MKKSPLREFNPVQGAAEAEVKDVVKKKIIKKVASSTAKKALGLGGKLLGAAGVVKMGYDAYKGGQKESGGRVGYHKNPNYDSSKAGDKHGDSGSNAQFVRKDGGKHTSIWDK